MDTWPIEYTLVNRIKHHITFLIFVVFQVVKPYFQLQYLNLGIFTFKISLKNNNLSLCINFRIIFWLGRTFRFAAARISQLHSFMIVHSWPRLNCLGRLNCALEKRAFFDSVWLLNSVGAALTVPPLMFSALRRSQVSVNLQWMIGSWFSLAKCKTKSLQKLR